MRTGLALLLLALLPLAPRAQQAADVPIERVVLFASGVGYVQHTGTVQGDAEVVLRFSEAQLSDVLKSLVAEDLGGGRVEGALFPSQAPLGRSLQAFPLDPRRPGGLVALLEQLRGVEVEVTTRGEVIRGLLVGAALQAVAGGEGEVPVATLATPAGLRSVPLTADATVRPMDPALQADLLAAFRTLASHRQGGGLPVRLLFAGAGSRRVRFGYVTEQPVWKTSYRLTLPDGEGGQGRLQGWAIVENQTDRDWEGVSLSLVSGRPISFVTDLASPLFLSRPRVATQTVAPLAVPQEYGEGVAANAIAGRVTDAATGEPLPGASVQIPALGRGASAGPDGSFEMPGLPPGTYEVQASLVGYGAQSFSVTVGAGGGGRADFRLRRGGGLSEVVVTGESASLRQRAGMDLDFAAAPPAPPPPMDPTRSVRPEAVAGTAGELFEYTLNDVTLPRQQAAMLPLVAGGVRTERVSLFRVGQGPHPLRGARLTNTTGQHLQAGPVTLFDEGAYAGDALLPDLPPGRERFLSFAVDLDVVVTLNAVPGTAGAVTTGRIVEGVLEMQRRFVMEQRYTVENKGSRAKTVILEHPRHPQAELTAPSPLELTEGGYRFRVRVGAGQAETLTIREERPQTERIALWNATAAQALGYAEGTRLPPDVRRALERAAEFRRAVDAAEREAGQALARLDEARQEQARVRENLRAVAEGSDFYRQQLARLEALEREIEARRQEHERLQQAQREAEQGLTRYLSELRVG